MPRGPVRGGLEGRSGTITREHPVQFHVHNHGHWLTCCLNLIVVETEHQGAVTLLPGEMLWVEANERHKLTAPSGLAKYSCVGLEGL